MGDVFLSDFFNMWGENDPNNMGFDAPAIKNVYSGTYLYATVRFDYLKIGLYV